MLASGEARGYGRGMRSICDRCPNEANVTVRGPGVDLRLCQKCADGIEFFGPGDFSISMMAIDLDRIEAVEGLRRIGRALFGVAHLTSRWREAQREHPCLTRGDFLANEARYFGSGGEVLMAGVLDAMCDELFSCVEPRIRFEWRVPKREIIDPANHFSDVSPRSTCRTKRLLLVDSFSNEPVIRDAMVEAARRAAKEAVNE